MHAGLAHLEGEAAETKEGTEIRKQKVLGDPGDTLPLPVTSLLSLC